MDTRSQLWPQLLGAGCELVIAVCAVIGVLLSAHVLRVVRRNGRHGDL